MTSLPRLLVALLEYEGGVLGVGGDLGRGQQGLIKLLGSEIYPVPQIPALHVDVEGKHLDAQFLRQFRRAIR